MIVDKESINYLSQMIDLYETNPGMRLGNYCVECNEAITEYDDKWHVTYKGDVLICCEGFIPFSIEDGMLEYKCGGHVIINDESERRNKDDILIADKPLVMVKTNEGIVTIPKRSIGSPLYEESSFRLHNDNDECTISKEEKNNDD